MITNNNINSLDVEEKIEFIPNDISVLFASAKWEDKKTAMTNLYTNLTSKSGSQSQEELASVYSLIKTELKNFKEININLIKESLPIFSYILSHHPKPSEFCFELFSGFYDKVATKNADDIEKLFLIIIDIIQGSFFTKLFSKLKNEKKITLIKQYASFFYKYVTLNGSLGYINKDEIIMFAVSMANNPNVNIRNEAIKLFTLLYQHIGYDLRKAIKSEIKDSTYHLIENEFNNFDSNNINNYIDINAIEAQDTPETTKIIRSNTFSANSKSIQLEFDFEKCIKTIKTGNWAERKTAIESLTKQIDLKRSSLDYNIIITLIKEKLSDKQQKFLLLIISLVNTLVKKLQRGFRNYFSFIATPLILNLNDNNEQIRKETAKTLSLISEYDSMDNVISYCYPLLKQDKFNLRNEILNLILENKEKITNKMLSSMIENIILCSQDKNGSVREISEEIISYSTDFIDMKEYIDKANRFKPVIAEKVIKTIKSIYGVVEESENPLNMTAPLLGKETDKKKSKLGTIQDTSYENSNVNTISRVKRNEDNIVVHDRKIRDNKSKSKSPSRSKSAPRARSKSNESTDRSFERNKSRERIKNPEKGRTIEKPTGKTEGRSRKKERVEIVDLSYDEPESKSKEKKQEKVKPRERIREVPEEKKEEVVQPKRMIKSSSVGTPEKKQIYKQNIDFLSMKKKRNEKDKKLSTDYFSVISSSYEMLNKTKYLSLFLDESFLKSTIESSDSLNESIGIFCLLVSQNETFSEYFYPNLDLVLKHIISFVPKSDKSSLFSIPKFLSIFYDQLIVNDLFLDLTESILLLELMINISEKFSKEQRTYLVTILNKYIKLIGIDISFQIILNHAFNSEVQNVKEFSLDTFTNFITKGEINIEENIPNIQILVKFLYNVGKSKEIYKKVKDIFEIIFELFGDRFFEEKVLANLSQQDKEIVVSNLPQLAKQDQHASFGINETFNQSTSDSDFFSLKNNSVDELLEILSEISSKKTSLKEKEKKLDLLKELVSNQAGKKVMIKKVDFILQTLLCELNQNLDINKESPREPKNKYCSKVLGLISQLLSTDGSGNISYDILYKMAIVFFNYLQTENNSPLMQTINSIMLLLLQKNTANTNLMMLLSIANEYKNDSDIFLVAINCLMNYNKQLSSSDKKEINVEEILNKLNEIVFEVETKPIKKKRGELLIKSVKKILLKLVEIYGDKILKYYNASIGKSRIRDENIKEWITKILNHLESDEGKISLNSNLSTTSSKSKRK